MTTVNNFSYSKADGSVRGKVKNIIQTKAKISIIDDRSTAGRTEIPPNYILASLLTRTHKVKSLFMPYC